MFGAISKHRARLIIQIDGIHIKDDLTLLAAVGIDGDGKKHPLGVTSERLS